MMQVTSHNTIPDTNTEVRQFHNYYDFKRASLGFMKADPLSTNVIGVHLQGVISGARPHHKDDIFFVLTERGNVRGVAMHTPPYNLFVSRMLPHAAAMLASYLHNMGHALPGVSGETCAATSFAESWAALTNSDVILGISMRLYRLEHLRSPSGTAGSAITASPENSELLGKWLLDFSAEATPDKPTDEIEAVVRRRISAQELMIWTVDGIAVSLAGRSAIVDGVARIGPVFTPLEYRRHGYGAAVTAAAAQSSLEGGAEIVVLYTDLNYPTSNAIYQSIGFIPDHDAKEIYLAPQ